MMNKVAIWVRSDFCTNMSYIGIINPEEMSCLSNNYNDSDDYGLFSTITSKETIFKNSILKGLSSIAEMDIPLSYIGRP